MKQQILERARGTVETFLREQYADAALEVLSVSPEVDGYGAEFLWIYLKYDDGKHGKGVPDSSARLRLKGRLRSELQGADVEASPVVSFIAESEVEYEEFHVGAASRIAEDPILALRGLGSEVWADEDADAYVLRQRKGWQ